MINILVETKNDYTTHLVNILSPLVFEGVQSVYKQSLEISKNDDVLKIFQSFLKAIPKWNQDIINKETNRILNSSHSYSWLNDLIKATLKSTLIVLTYNPTCKTQSKIDSSLYQNIKTTDFIHKIYIECARELWNNPYLLYHNYPPIEIKRNQRDCINIIKDCIKEGIRKLLPVKHILKLYLGEDEDIVDDYKDDQQFDKPLTEIEEKNLTKIIKKDLSLDNDKLFKINEENDTSSDNLQSKIETKQNSNSEEKTIGTRIDNILNNSVSPTDINSILSNIDEDANVDVEISETSQTNINIFNNKIKTEQQNNNIKNNLDSIDSKLKKTLQYLGTDEQTLNDLDLMSDDESSLNYTQEKFQEIFSNGGIPVENPKEPNDLKPQENLFTNYFNI